EGAAFTGFHTQPEAPLDDIQDADDLARAWVGGATIDWQARWLPEPPQPIEAPKYVFLKERHWLSADEAAHVAQQHKIVPMAEVLRIPSHSTLFEEHRIGGRAILPATAAIAHCHARACAGLAKKSVIELSEVVWLRPI